MNLYEFLNYFRSRRFVRYVLILQQPRFCLNFHDKTETHQATQDHFLFYYYIGTFLWPLVT